MLKQITQNPILNLICGLILLATAAIETFESFHELSIGAHHGILVFSIIQIAKSLPEIMHGLKEIEESETT